MSERISKGLSLGVHRLAARMTNEQREGAYAILELASILLDYPESAPFMNVETIVLFQWFKTNTDKEFVSNRLEELDERVGKVVEWVMKNEGRYP